MSNISIAQALTYKAWSSTITTRIKENHRMSETPYLTLLGHKPYTNLYEPSHLHLNRGLLHSFGNFPRSLLNETLLKEGVWIPIPLIGKNRVTFGFVYPRMGPKPLRTCA